MREDGAEPDGVAVNRARSSRSGSACILVGKCCDHLPLYRQSGIYAREWVGLDRATMAAWVGKVAALTAPLIEAGADHGIGAAEFTSRRHAGSRVFRLVELHG